MWISRKHYDLIREKAADFRKWHEDQIKLHQQTTATLLADKDAIIHSQEARLVAMEVERRELTERLWTREVERMMPPAAAPEPAEPETWELMMERRIAEMNEADKRAANGTD